MRNLVALGRYRSAAPSSENEVVDQESACLAAAGRDVELYRGHSDDIAGWSLARKAAMSVRSVWNGRVRQELVPRLELTRPGVVHVHNTFPLISSAVLYACRDAGVPVVAETIHIYKLPCASGDFFPDGKPCHDCASGRGVAAVRPVCLRGSRVAAIPVVAGTAGHRSVWQRRVSACIFITAVQRDLMRDLDLFEERVFVKRNSVPLLATHAGDREHIVTYLGRLDTAKEARFLMEAWDLVRARNPQSALRLVIAGGGLLEEEVRGWRSRRASAEVVGMLPRTDAARLLRRALAAIIPSQWEQTFGLVVVKAMVAGVAPIAPARGSFRELITDRVNGVLSTPEDRGALPRILEDVDTEPPRYTGYGRQGQETYQRCFQPGANLEQLLGIYRFAISNPIGSAHVSA